MVQVKLADIYFQLKADIDEIEKQLDDTIRSQEHLLEETSSHILKAGGKRIRPIFVLLSGKFGHYDLSRLIKVAVPLEMIHMATLVHDDVIDDADKRRGISTVKSKWDNKLAMYTGDFLFSKALSFLTDLKEPRLHQVLSRAIMEMCIGEIEQVRDIHQWDVGLRPYLRRIKRKTALLISVSCELGAIAGKADPQTVYALRRYGYDVGMAFQITDDILDFTSTEKKLGKPAGSDMKQGNITLPALYAYHCSSYREKLQTWIHDDNREAYMDDAVKWIRNSGGVEYAKDVSDRYLNRARKWIAPFPDHKHKKSLLDITRFIGNRQF